MAPLNHLVTGLGITNVNRPYHVEGAVASDGADLFVRWNLVAQMGPHGAIALVVWSVNSTARMLPVAVSMA